MRKKRDPETNERRDERLEREARLRIQQGFAEDNAVAAAIRRSIELYGA